MCRELGLVFALRDWLFASRVDFFNPHTCLILSYPISLAEMLLGLSYWMPDDLHTGWRASAKCTLYTSGLSPTVLLYSPPTPTRATPCPP